MAVFKCKMCGGDLNIQEGITVSECVYCGTKQTIPSQDSDKKLNLFNRANNLRIKSEFDKASGIYESIVAESPDEAEAYWGLVLCKYGIEYIDDVDGKKIPTCHRTLPVSIMEDEDFDMACANADAEAKTLYREEAKIIDGIQKKILEIASAETPYDIFICYKETDESTNLRTEDSALAQDIYTELTKEGYKVFFSRVSLREVAGSEYEPHIYAALSSATVMLAIGSKFEYYDAVWVKNEWSRFISMMQEKKSKVLIPCYKNMDAYDMPKEFKNMQALDMTDVTFLSSLMTNVKRIISKDDHKQKEKEDIVKEVAATSKLENITSLLKRVEMFLEDEKFQSAGEYCEKVLDVDPENGKAYFYKFLVEAKVSSPNKITNSVFIPLNRFSSYSKAVRFGDEEQKAFLRRCEKEVQDAYNKATYKQYLEKAYKAKNSKEWHEVANGFSEIRGYEKSAEFSDKAVRKSDLYDQKVSLNNSLSRQRLLVADAKFERAHSKYWGFGFLREFLVPKIIMGIGIALWALIIWGISADNMIEAVIEMSMYLFNFDNLVYTLVSWVMIITALGAIFTVSEAIIKTAITLKKNIKGKSEFKKNLEKKEEYLVTLEKQISETEMEYNRISFDV